MRISADKYDPGHRIEARWAVVYLDGRRIDHAVTADEEQREVVIELYENGRPVITTDEDGDVCIARKTLKGDVKIRFRHDAPAFVRADHLDRIEAAA